MNKAITEAMLKAARDAFREMCGITIYLPGEGDLDDFERARFEALEAVIAVALDMAPAQPVAIKPLEWGCSPEWKAGEFVNEWFTYSLCGRYSVWCDPTIDLNLWHVSYPLPSDQPYEGTEHDSIEAAKAAAQSDYESRIRSALLPQPAVPGEVQVKHKKRGSVYDVIGVGRMQAESWIDEARPAPVDMREVTIYRSVDDGALWVRPREEFEDGRFEALSVPLPEIEGGDKGDGWQPMSTAPIDGTDILVCVTYNISDDEWETMQWVDWQVPAIVWPVFRDRIDIPFPPTHWMHLPAAPSASIGETP